MDFELLFLLKKGGFDGQRQKLGSRMYVLSEQSHGSKQLQPLSRGKADCKYNLKVLLTLDTLTLLCIFSIQFPRHFLRCWQGEFVHQSKANISMVIISFVLMTLMCDSQVMLKGEIRC